MLICNYMNKVHSIIWYILKSSSSFKLIMASMKDASSNSSMDMSGYHGEKLIYPAATRNQEPILQVLKRFIIPDPEYAETLLLEVSSGSGQHVAHFAPNFPQVIFQPSEYDKSLFGSIIYYANACKTRNVRHPIFIDITNELSACGLRPDSLDYIYNANMMHISPFDCTLGLFRNAGIYLKPDALMITYGPYAKDGAITPESNVSFDASLKSRNPLWGLRDINDLIDVGLRNKLSLIDTIDMPANNKILIWRKDL